nr:xylulose kinase-1 [Tanacetum cinerariifolium]
MQKYLLKQQFEGFSVSTSEGLHKGYDRSLPSSWSQVALIVRTKLRLDTLSFDDLYNNLRVFERDVKVFLFLLSQNHNMRDLHHTLMKLFTTSLQINQVDMISMRIKKFHKRTGRKLQFDTKDPVGFDKAKAECFNCHKIRHFVRNFRAKGNQDSKRGDIGYNGNKTRGNDRRPAYQDDTKALVTIDGEDINWSGHVEEDAQNYDMMAYSSSNSSSDNEVSNLEDTSVNDRYAVGMHAVPPPMIGNYMPSRPDIEIDYLTFTYGPKQTLVDESDFKPKNTPKVVCEPKVWTDAPIIEEYKSDSDNDLVSNVQEDKEKPSFAFTDSVKHVKTFRENVNETCTPNHSLKIEKHDRNGHTRKGLGYAFTRKACFVCGSFSHLIRDCDFHDKRLAKQAEFTISKNKATGQRENRPAHDKEQAHLIDYQEFKSGSVAFGGSNRGITGKEKIKAVSCESLGMDLLWPVKDDS